MKTLVLILFTINVFAQTVSMKIQYAERLINDAIALQHYKTLSSRCDSILIYQTKTISVSNSIIMQVDLKTSAEKRLNDYYKALIERQKRREKTLKLLIFTGFLAGGIIF